MDKPITVERMEFAEAMVQLINSSSLPAFVISDVMKSALQHVEALSDAQYENEKKLWEKAQADKESADNEHSDDQE